MIPRIPTPSLRFDELPPFGRLKHEARPLSFVFDPTQLSEGEARDVVLAYTASGTVKVYATPPVDGAHDLELPEIPEGYAPAHPLDDALWASWSEPGSGNGHFAVGGISHRLRAAREHAVHTGCSEAEAQRAALLVATAEQLHGCDGLISDDAIVRAFATQQSTIHTTDEAAALIGLRQRVDGDFSLGPDMGPFGRFYFYWVLARELTPAGWRWFSACLANSADANGDAEIGDIAGSGIQRLDSALRARDLFHREAKKVPTGSADEALFYFETTMLYLSAAFDVTARVAARVYRPGGSLNASWRSQRWLARLAARDDTLAGLMQPETATRDALEAVQLLRNTIHGEALRGVDHQGRGERRSLIHVPPSELQELLTVVERRGGRARWGIEEYGTAYVDPQIYIEAMIADAAPALDALMAATDVGRLRGVDLATIRGAPPTVPSATPLSWTDFDPFAFEHRRRLRALGGFPPIDTSN